MAVKLFFLLLLTVAVYAQEHTTLHPDTREMADIGGKQYWFTNDFVGVEWIGADFACKNQSMVLTSLETQQEYDDVVAWLRSNKDDSVVVKAVCYPSQRKNDPPRPLYFSYKNESIVSFYCSCQAGLIACTHLSGLCFAIAAYVCKSFVEIPEKPTCTSKEQEWHKPRGCKITPEPLMGVTFAQAKDNERSRAPISCSFSSCKREQAPTSDEILNFQKKIRAVDKNSPLSYLLTDREKNIETQEVPLGVINKKSVLDYQLRTFEFENQEEDSELIFFPPLPISTVDSDFNSYTFQDKNKIVVTMDQAHAIEKLTRQQGACTEWQKERKFRLNSSKFGKLCKRKKEMDETFLKEQICPRDLSKVAAIKIGRESESKGLQRYVKYMKEINTPVKLLNVGVVVNPGNPNCATTPDGKVVDLSCDENDTEKYGLVELKTLASKNYSTVEEACKIKTFYCTQNDEGKIKLKRSDDRYYQVQGQLYLTGLSWCDFVVYDGKNVAVERIHCDTSFCQSMITKLNAIYFNLLLPYIENNNITS